MNLAYLGLTAMNAAQHRMMTTGHNIANKDTEGYNRQRVLSGTAGAAATGAGYIGRGVVVSTVERAYDRFLSTKVMQGQTRSAALIAYGTEIAQVNNLFGDRTVGVAATLQTFFAGVNAVASSPADPAARQELLGRAASLVNQINSANAMLDNQRNNLNTQIDTQVTQINSYLAGIGDLNQQIIVARANASGHAPNDLLDQRDQLLTELGRIIDITPAEMADGTISVTVGNGQLAVSGDTVYPLHAVPSATDPTRLVIAYSSIDHTGRHVPVALPEDSVQGGSLGGLLAYRKQALDAIQNDLGHMAAGLALAVNAIHGTGVDANGAAGQAMFTLADIKALSHTTNQGNAVLTARFTGDANAITSSDYRIRYDANNARYTITRLSDKKTFEVTGFPAKIDGLTLECSHGTPADGDTWLLQPTRQAAAGIKLNLHSPDQIAAASADGGSANGENALKIAALQTQKVLGGGTTSLNEAYAQIVSKVAVMTQQNGTSAKAQEALLAYDYGAQQAVSGVNVNEEEILLNEHLEQFRAASRMIDVSNAMFDALLGLHA